MSPDVNTPAESPYAREVDRIIGEFEKTFSRAEVEQCFRKSLQSLQGSRVQFYVRSIAERFTRERLRAMGQSKGSIAKHVPEILFVCKRDAGRSQMAAAFANKLSGGRVSARSAGEHHADDVQPAVLEAMREAEIDLTEAFPKPVMDEVVRAADVVVTMDCGESTCAYYPGKSYLAWEIPDPAGKQLADVRAIRDALRDGVNALLTELRVPHASSGS